jgi:hypothetical protein
MHASTLKLVNVQNDLRHVSANHVTIFMVVKYHFTYLKMERQILFYLPEDGYMIGRNR